MKVTSWSVIGRSLIRSSAFCVSSLSAHLLRQACGAERGNAYDEAGWKGVGSCKQDTGRQ